MANEMRIEEPTGRCFKFAGRSVRLGGALGVLVLLVGTLAAANDVKDVKLSSAQRMAIFRTFLAERPFVHRAFSKGKTGIRIERDQITPSEAEMNSLIAQFGSAAKVGERVQITAVRFEHQGIVFEINGGPVKHKSWKDHINVGMNGADPRSRQPSQPNNDSVYVDSNGSSVFLALTGDAASLTTDQIKDMLLPVLDFKATSVAEAYQKSLPPVLAKAIKDHHALVGMDKEMVSNAMGRPPRRVREKDYEEWIYGNPPQDVQFIRFREDKVVQIEEMKVSGEKVVRTQDEVGDLGGSLNASAKKETPGAMAAADSAPEQPSKPPTLLRPGEKAGDDAARESKRDPNLKPPPDVSAPGPK